MISLGEGNSGYAHLEEAALAYHREAPYGHLIDLLMRLFKLAGYRRVVLFIDEFERIYNHIYEEDLDLKGRWAIDILNNFSNFCDTAVRESGESYPAITQIIAMPDYMKEFIEKHDTALFTRLFDVYPIAGRPRTQKNQKEIKLEEIKLIDAKSNDIIGQVGDLLQKGGYQITTNLRNPQLVDQLLEDIYQQLEDEKQLATPRNLLPRIIEEIDIKYVR